MANKRLHPDSIKDAIAKGENDLAEAKKIEIIKKAEEQAKLEAYSLEVKASIEKWGAEELPGLIRERTANGSRRINLGSVDTDKISLGYGLEIFERVRMVRDMGLDVEETHYESDPGSDGAYSHGSGTSYTLVW